MCGIYGKISLTKELSEASSEVQRMMKISEYRGPDSNCVQSFENACLGFNRLAIIDLDPRSDQPFTIEKFKKTIVFNGEIYNYIELRDELKLLGYSFTTESDTEVALTAFQHYGAEAFSKFNGMWAMCIYSHETGVAVLCRDRFGVKPLYYSVQNECLYFASEIKSLKAANITATKCIENESVYLEYGINKFPNNSTLYKEILEHEAGTYTKIENGKLHNIRFYQPPQENVQINFEQIKKELYDTFIDSLKIRVRSDVPIALMLSGGLDSSLIAFHLNELIKTKQINHEKIQAFTLNFQGFEQNEYELVTKIGALIPHIKIQSIDIDYDEFLLHFPEISSKQDVPVLSISHLIHTFALSKIKVLGYTVLLNGQGADEVFGGYFPKDFYYLFWDLFKRDKRLSVKELIQFKKKWNKSFTKLLVGLCESHCHIKNPRLFGYLKTRGRMGSIIAASQNLNISRFGANSYARQRALQQTFETQFNGILHYEDMSSMQNSIEMRSPFMDFRLINIGLSLPADFKVRDGYSKWLLREALGNVLPEHIRWATWKLGYNVPKNELYRKLSIAIEENTDERNLNGVWRRRNL